jgi:hypothetical protein
MNRHDLRWDWLGIPAADAAAIVGDRIYGRDRWGCFSTEEYATVNGVFYWFDSVLEMLTFLSLVEPQVFDEKEDGEIVTRLRAMVSGERRLSPELRQRVNATARGLFRIDWWGKGGELATSRSDFAQELRREFREGGPTASITPAEMREWEKFIRRYQVS